MDVQPLMYTLLQHYSSELNCINTYEIDTELYNHLSNHFNFKKIVKLIILQNH